MLAGMSKRSDAVARWREILRRQGESGLSVAAFCRRSRISQPSFYVWRRRLHEAATLTEVRASGTFAEVCVSPESSRVGGSSQSRLPQQGGARDLPHQDGVLELVLLGGRRIVVRPGFDRATLLALIDAAEDDAWTYSTQERSRAAGEMGITTGGHRRRAPHSLNARRESGA